MKKLKSVRMVIAVLIVAVLFFSSVFAGMLWYILNKLDVFPALRLGPILLFLVSVIISMVISSVFGKHFIKMIRELIAATTEISRGNFSVRVKELSGDGEFGQLTKSFNMMAEELGSIEMFRNDFINTFSHEFKTPIVSIQGFAKMLKKDSLTQQERSEYADIIISESARLTNMSSNILLLSKFENQQLINENADYFLDEQIRTCVLQLEKKWSKKNILFNMDLPQIPYRNNEDMMSHIWLNILDNAIKFSPDNSEIEISAITYNKYIQIDIRDHGCGMSQDTLDSMFDKFFQGDTAHSTEGNGLGLPLVRRIVELCGGKITVESLEGKGTTFRVWLPVDTNRKN